MSLKKINTDSKPVVIYSILRCQSFNFSMNLSLLKTSHIYVKNINLCKYARIELTNFISPN